MLPKSSVVSSPLSVAGGSSPSCNGPRTTDNRPKRICMSYDLDYPTPQPADSFDFKHILYTKANGRATVTINRPEVYNCFNFRTLRELARACEDASWDEQVGVLVLTGAGERAFCTGADLDEQQQFLERPQDYWKWMGAFIEAHDKLRNIGKPTLARLNGMAVGGGNELNMACDLAIAAEHVVIRQVVLRVAACRPAARHNGCPSWSAIGARARCCGCASRSRPPKRSIGAW